MPQKSAQSVIDLFAGVGGLSLGAARAGFNLAAAVEVDKHASAAHHLNFPSTETISQDINSLSGDDLLRKAGLKRGELSGLIGGPPCQGFSTIGRRDADDPRNTLFSRFFELVADLKPAFFLAENVPGILQERNDDARNKALALIPKNYVMFDPIKVRANEYGAPTTRTRMFFIGYDPNRVSDLSMEDFLPPDDAEDIRVARALRGVPELGSSWETGDGWQKVRAAASNTYFGHRLNDCIPFGVGNAEAIMAFRKQRSVSGFLSTTHTAETIKRFKSLEVGRADAISKSVRLNPEGYCPTLRAGTGPDRGSYQAVRPVHPTEPRVICPREAARLQGFPDWFQFNPTKWHAFRQIGNSVSPIVAEVILKKLYASLR